MPLVIIMPKRPTTYIIGLHLSDEELQKLEEYCRRNGLSKNKAIRKLINEHY